MTQNATIPASMQKVLQARFNALSAAVRDMGRDRLKPQTQDAIIADIEEMLQDTFTGLHATIEDIRDIITNTTPEQWDAIQPQSMEVLTLLKEYGQMLHMELGITGKVNFTGDEDISNSREYEYTAQNGDTITGTINSAPLYTYCKLQGNERKDTRDRANIYRHVLFIFQAAAPMQNTAFYGKPCTMEELKGITPAGCSPIIARVMREKNEESLQQLYDYFKIGRHDRGQDANTIKNPNSSRREQLINTMQNTADMLSRSINTADMNEDGQALITRPLLQALTEKKARAKAQAMQHADGRTGAELEAWANEQAAAMVPSSTYVMQALRGAVVISNLEKPVADGSEKATYRMNLLQLTQHCTGQENPNKKQIQNTWQAWCFLSTQQVEFIEYRQVGASRRRRRKKNSGTASADAAQTPTPQQAQSVEVRNYAPYKIRTNPATATFVQPLQAGQDYSGSTEVFIDIHHIITEGRRQELVTLEDGRKAYIKAPVQHLNSLQQLYEFSSPAEIHFYGCILSKSHIMEEELLKGIFDYDNRLKNCANAEDKKKEKRNQQKNKGRDRDAVQDMFIRAKETGLIAWYSRYETIDRSNGKPAFAWKWGRPEDSSKLLK